MHKLSECVRPGLIDVKCPVWKFDINIHLYYYNLIPTLEVNKHSVKPILFFRNYHRNKRIKNFDLFPGTLCFIAFRFKSWTKLLSPNIFDSSVFDSWQKNRKQLVRLLVITIVCKFNISKDGFYISMPILTILLLTIDYFALDSLWILNHWQLLTITMRVALLLLFTFWYYKN